MFTLLIICSQYEIVDSYCYIKIGYETDTFRNNEAHFYVTVIFPFYFALMSAFVLEYNHNKEYRRLSRKKPINNSNRPIT